MKRFLKIILPLIIIGALAYQYRNVLVAEFVRFFPPTPCSQPIPYQLGAFDTQFNISKSYFLGALADAEAILEKPQVDYLGKNLFNYEPADSSPDVLKINLIYDYRQQAESKLASLGIVVNNDRASYDMLKAKFTALQTEYTTEKNVFSAGVATFNQAQQALNQQVNDWNGKGGAPKQQYDQLQAQTLALKNEAANLQVTQNHLNGMVDEINALVATLNQLADTLNLSVDRYNAVGAPLGESFEEGLYQSNGASREIDIYEFTNRDKLVRVLAHELGHALGLGHVADPKAIMYAFNQGTGLALTAADLAALKTECQKK